MCRTLTKVLLKRDFGLEWDMPDSHLVPGLTGRINYLNWINEVLSLLPSQEGKTCNSGSVAITEATTRRTIVNGIDIGTGASCIYPLLGHSLYSWKFMATDIDIESIESARKIVSMNHLEDSIQIVQRTPEQPLLEGVVKEGVDFCMCNPPFFSSAEEVDMNMIYER